MSWVLSGPCVEVANIVYTYAAALDDIDYLHRR